jgi:5-methyltetrahydropteroyltriglutamate--homocysteine methyltransferase
MTLPSATQFPAIAYKRGITDKVYSNHSALLWDIVGIMKAEVLALVGEGVQYVQIDAPRYSYYVDPKWRNYIKTEMGLEPDAALDEAIRADNACLEGARRAGVTLAMHLCRGNNRSHWYAEGGYDPIAEKMFSKTVVLGLVSSKRPQLESKHMLARRIEDAARYVPLEHLALSPQCGFASTMEGNLLSEDDQWAKLRLVAETAQEVWR